MNSPTAVAATPPESESQFQAELDDARSTSGFSDLAELAAAQIVSGVGARLRQNGRDRRREGQTHYSQNPRHMTGHTTTSHFSFLFLAETLKIEF
jgi:hypothetical protein